jgi:xylulokinase
MMASAFRRSVLNQPGAEIVEEYPERQLTSVCQAIAECVRKAGIASSDVAAIAIVGQMAGIIGVGRDGRNVTPYDSWLDTRCAPYITRMDREAGTEIVTQTGGPASFNHGPKILWWMHEHPKIFRSIKAFVQPGGYSAMRLCGLSARDAFIDKTYLHFSGFADNQAGRWNTTLCAHFSLDPAMLPRIVNPSEIVGQLTAQMARRCGLVAGVPVVAGCGDTAASFLACGATRQGICVDVAGTASVFAAVTKTFRPDRTKILSCGQAATPGLWHPYAYINGGGMNLEWFCHQIKGAGKTLPKDVTFENLDRQAQRLIPTDESPLFVPHLSGRVSPAWPRLRGAWVNLNRNHSAAHLWRAMLEGVALEYAIYKRAVLKLHPQLRVAELRVTGGGEKSELWNQIKADVLGAKVVQIARSEGAPAGAALLAAHGIGLIRNLDSGARQWLSTGKVTRPNRRLAAHYATRLKRYESLLNALNTWSDT